MFLTGVPAVGLSVASAVLGALAIRSILRSDGWLYGIGFAIPGVALMPLLIVQVLLIALTIMAAESIGLFALAIIYVGATTAVDRSPDGSSLCSSGHPVFSLSSAASRYWNGGRHRPGRPRVHGTHE